MSLFAGIKTIKKKEAEAPKKEEVSQAISGFNPSKAHGLYDPKNQKQDTTVNIADSIKIATVGDGGASWKRRALLRAKQKANDTGKSLNEVVTDLHGSTAQELAQEAKGAKDEKWKKRRSFHKPRDDNPGENHDRHDRRKSDGDQRGGGLRLGRSAKDSDVLARFRGKVQTGIERSGLDKINNKDHHNPVSFRQKRSREDRRDDHKEALSKERNEFENILKEIEEPKQLKEKQQPRSKITKIENSNIWDDVEQPPEQGHGGGRSNVDDWSEKKKQKEVSMATAEKTSRTQLTQLGHTPIKPTIALEKKSTNQSAAAALRARLLSKTPTSNKPTPVQPNSDSDDDCDEESVGLAPLDRQGRRLLALLEGDSLDTTQKEDLRSGKWRGKAKGSAAAAGGEEGAKRMDISSMAAFEREGGEDMDEVFARNIARLGGRYKGSEEKAGSSRTGVDEEEEVDMKMFQNVSARVTSKKLVEVQRNKAIAEEKRFSTLMNQSPFSVENPHFKHHLVIARGVHSYVMLVEKNRRLVNGQCHIVALQQAISSRAVQEEVWEEISNFKRALRRYHGSEGSGVLFLETALKGGRAWAHVECLPVPLECEEDAPLYFKQSLSGAESEWSTHRAIIDTARGLRKSIPVGFPYFHVEWARGGCAHIIEDAEEFGSDFGMSVVAGMLGIDHGMNTNRGHDSDSEIDQFRTSFAPFNPFNQK